MKLLLLFIIFFLVPLVEISLFVSVGGEIGVLATVLLTLATAAVGVSLLRRQGPEVFVGLGMAMSRGESPAQELLTGAFVLAGGVLMLTPGFFTDTLGLLCLLPASRAFLIRFLLPWLPWAWVVRRYDRTRTRGPNVIEGEYRRRDHDPRDHDP